MLRSLSAAVAGLRNQQTRMDVIGNNVSYGTSSFGPGSGPGLQPSRPRWRGPRSEAGGPPVVDCLPGARQP
jgi:hypothetical protein